MSEAHTANPPGAVMCVMGCGVMCGVMGCGVMCCEVCCVPCSTFVAEPAANWIDTYLAWVNPAAQCCGYTNESGGIELCEIWNTSELSHSTAVEPSVADSA